MAEAFTQVQERFTAYPCRDPQEIYDDPNSLTLKNLNARSNEIEAAADAVEIAAEDPSVQALLQKLVDAGDIDTIRHSERVAYSVHIIGSRLGFDEHDIQLMTTAALVHDVGKSKPEIQKYVQSTEVYDDKHPETPLFIETMNQHAEVGAEIINQGVYWTSDEQETIVELAHGHHAYKKVNAYGEIPTARNYSRGMVLAIADTFDSLSSRRGYKPPWDKTKSTEIVVKELDVDPHVIRAALQPTMSSQTPEQ